MATVSLTSGVRAALGSLSSIKDAASTSQFRLSTGKKVNSAVDDPVNFFTAAGLNDRASQLTKNLDGISNGIQTITAASQGIDSITKLVNSLQSTIKQAQADNAANRPKVTTAAIASTKDAALNTAVAGAGTFTLTAGSTQFSVTLTASNTIRDAVNEINKSGIATASVDDSGKLTVTGTGSSNLVIAGADAVVFAGLNGTATGASANSTVRANLVSQFNDLTKQIDQLAQDAGFNGKNLLNGDKISIIFNEKTGASQSKLDVQGSKITAANLGILQANNGTGTAGISFNVQDDADLSSTADALTNVLTSLRSTASSLGASLSTVQTRQDFTKNLANTLTAGADNLVQADTNQEAANLLALQTRQQLSQTALSLSNQADQAILRLF